MFKQEKPTELKEKEKTDSPESLALRSHNHRKKPMEVVFTGFLGSLLSNALQAYQQLPDAEHERFVERFSITICVGIACVLSSFFYWYLPPLGRVLVVPVFIGAAWWLGATVVAKFFKMQEIDTFDQCLKALELRYLFEAVKFSGITFAIAAIPFLCKPSQFEAALASADARTLFLCMFIWNLIGAPLFAQARDRKSRLIIALVFALPVVVGTIWWVSCPYHDF